MTPVLKILLSITTLAVSLYGIQVFGVSLWPALFTGLGLFILVSLFVPQLNRVAVVVSRTIGVLSLLAFALLLFAATTGGSFRMSDSNQIIAFALGLMTLLGCAFFLVKIRGPDA